MSFLLKREKEDLLELATELGLEATVDMTKPMLKNLKTKSPGYDAEDTKLMNEGIVEARKERELLEERERRDDLELEKLRIEAQIRLNQEMTLKQKTHTLPVRRPEVRGSNQAENFRKFDNHNTRRTGNFNPERRYLDTPPSRDFDRTAPRKCYIWHSLDHLSYNCPKARKKIKRVQPNSQVQSCSVTPQKGQHLKNIMLGNEIVSALIDTGSTTPFNNGLKIVPVIHDICSIYKCDSCWKQIRSKT
ncbi:hypothetical protein TNIN_163791 [Trichonephila inaurata madagascariensis]|uniref:Uncharacterized protein n=1 Tax=Trichonephila inaurata madagascariensis TaxID=2747483 RepID=A0A8X6YNT3_9ARAC|nr:hypothetical protein TNIN_163791 [Trichonephila inaurata madagascariensis]